ncbi:N-acylneuraminate cytidylyltransferase A [Anopheles bellator]|uniref:N-acylneuraminate cytidylyltransferase A n=1 Tax=Anopheles bellator TaxID=139047 RepID=UPI00264A20AA|nr:N-acylneuraminate cytidylyltransferase A [Anopheles bellator]
MMLGASFLLATLALCIDSSWGDSIAALILARGGSKGIPLKNIVELAPNETLLGRALDTIRRASVFNDIWVSTDHELIAREAERHGATVFTRSVTHAQDHSTSLEATREFLEAHPEIDRFALIQCTSPLLRPHYLENAAHQLSPTGPALPCVFSVLRSYKLRWRKMDLSGLLEPLNFDPKARPRRQDWTGELVETGMFYFTNRRLVMEEGTFQNERCGVVEVEELDALEIDDAKDLEMARLLIAMD